MMVNVCLTPNECSTFNRQNPSKHGKIARQEAVQLFREAFEVNPELREAKQCCGAGVVVLSGGLQVEEGPDCWLQG